MGRHGTLEIDGSMGAQNSENTTILSQSLAHCMQSLDIGPPDPKPFNPPTGPRNRQHSLSGYKKHTPSTQSSSSTLESDASTSSPLTPRTWLVYRPDKARKNVIITASGIKHNIAQMQDVINADGSRSQVELDTYKDGQYDLLQDLARMGASAAKFWARNSVEISIDMRTFVVAENSPTVLEQLDKLGTTQFCDHAQQVYINLDYPTPPPVSPTELVKYSGKPKAVPRPQDCTPIDVNTPAVIFMTKLICRIVKLKSLNRLVVTLRTPLTSETSITAEQLNYVVPFMMLEDWTLYWQAVYLKTPQIIPHKSWATRYLGAQWLKVHEEFAKTWEEVKTEYDAQFPVKATQLPQGAKGRGKGKRRAEEKREGK